MYSREELNKQKIRLAIQTIIFGVGVLAGFLLLIKNV